MTASGARWRTVEIDGHAFRRVELNHEEVEGRSVEAVESGVDADYDRRWELTRRFCRFLLSRPELVEGLRVFVAGAGVGLEAVVVGRRAASVTVNDVAPTALELQQEQLTENGIRSARVVSGPFEEASLEGVDLVVACYVVNDDESRESMSAFLERTGQKGIPALLANEEQGGHFSRLLESTGRRVQELQVDEDTRFVWIA